MALWYKYPIAKDGYKPGYREVVFKILFSRKQAINFVIVFVIFILLSWWTTGI